MATHKYFPPWPDEDKEIVEFLWRLGLRDWAIATFLSGRTRWGVCELRKALDLRDPPGGPSGPRGGLKPLEATPGILTKELRKVA